MPLLIWLIGRRILGPYTHGVNPNAGPMALLGDFFSGLQHGALTFWIVVIGPAALILLTRLTWALIRRP